MNWKNLLVSSAESANDALRLRNEYLRAENRILRQQINSRVQLTNSDRKELAEIGAKLGKKALEEIATVARPDTILAWNRKLADQPLAISKPLKSVGRPRVDQEVENWVIRMARENRSWGYDRIQGALNHLGYKVSDQTVGNILKRNGILPAPERKKTVTWREFVRFHLSVLLATDFFNSDIWSQCGFAIACLIGFIKSGYCQIRCVGTALHRYEKQFRSLMLHFLDRRVHRQRGGHRINGTQLFARSRLMRFRQGISGNVIGFMPDKEQKARSPALGQVAFLSATPPCGRRDSPGPRQQELNGFLNDGARKAA